MERCCQTCAHWGDDDPGSRLAGGFRYCLRARDGTPINPKAPDAGRWCAWHRPKPAPLVESMA